MVLNQFESPLCGCFDEVVPCLIVTFVPFGGGFIQGIAVQNASQPDHAKKINEGIEGTKWIVPCLLYNFLACFGAAMNRGQVRTPYNIEGGYCGDCCLHCCCSPCAVCQEYRETIVRKGKRV